jgi:hypothetical protein
MRGFLSLVVTISALLFIGLAQPASGEHLPSWSIDFPENEITVEEDVKFTLLVINNSESPVYGLRLVVDDNHFSAENLIQTTINDSSRAQLYEISISFVEEGNISLQVEFFNGTDWSELGNVNISVERENDHGSGKPDLNICAIIVIIGTIISMFLTWAYFQGRKIQKERSGSSSGDFKCSECGKNIGMTDTKCPWCGVEITGDEYLCGKCGHPVDEGDRKCSRCGADLAPSFQIRGQIQHGESIKNRISRKRKNTSLKESQKTICGECGTVLVASERTCPICGKNR